MSIRTVCLVQLSLTKGDDPVYRLKDWKLNSPKSVTFSLLELATNKPKFFAPLKNTNFNPNLKQYCLEGFST